MIRVEKPTAAPGAARVGIGGPVGSGKTALIEALIPRFAAMGVELAVITNDLVTDLWSAMNQNNNSGG